VFVTDDQQDIRSVDACIVWFHRHFVELIAVT
jgi:hypothetical protein